MLTIRSSWALSSSKVLKYDFGLGASTFGFAGSGLWGISTLGFWTSFTFCFSSLDEVFSFLTSDLVCIGSSIFICTVSRSLGSDFSGEILTSGKFSVSIFLLSSLIEILSNFLLISLRVDSKLSSALLSVWSMESFAMVEVMLSSMVESRLKNSSLFLYLLVNAFSCSLRWFLFLILTIF